MSHAKSCLVLLCSLLVFTLSVVDAAAFWGGDYLVQINGEDYTEQDYRHWWAEWQDPGMAVHDSVDPYVDFMLLAGEAADMQLFDNPGYKKKLDVFLKVRALMQLKAEEIDARKVIPPRDELWQAYQKEYTPILNLRMIAVQEEEQANVIQQFMASGVPFEQLATAAGLGKVAEQLEATGPMRFTRIPEPLREVAVPLQQGETAGPVRYGHAWYFLEVMERNDGTDEDFESLKQNLIRASLKRQEAELTEQLLEQLRAEYEVTIEQDLIDNLGPDGPSAEDAKRIAITIGDLQIPTSFVFASIEKTKKTRGHGQTQEAAFKASKERVVNDILVQVLTEMASLDRHYEEVPPLKYVYDFYKRYRLVKEFEESVVKPQVKVTEEAIAAYYQQNQEQFSRDGLLEYAQVTTNESQLAAQIAEQLKNGADFFTVMQPISPAGVPMKKEPLAHLRPVIQEAVKSLSSGQVATIVDGDSTHFVKVIRAAEAQVMPLDKARDMIVETLKKQFFADLRADYVQQLRDRSTIKVNSRAWKRLRQQLLEEEGS
jgi:hypothetical protein